MTDDDIYHRKLEEIFANTLTSTGFNVAVSALLATFIFMTLESAVLYVFTGIMVLVQIVRVLIYGKVRKYFVAENVQDLPEDSLDLQGWSRLYWYASMATAVIWACMASYSIYFGSLSETTFALVVMAGICAGAVGTMSSLIKFFAPYVLIILLPCMALLLFVGGEMQIFLAICAGLFAAFLISTSVNTHQRFDSNTNQFYSRALMLNQLKEKTSKLDRYAREMTKVSNTDVLTRVSIRRHLDAVLLTEFESSRKKMKPLALVLCDIDNFKQLNDTYGHHAGDACLQQVAKLLVNEINGDTDLVARLGGDEFVVLLPGRSGTAAAEFVQQIQSKLLRENPELAAKMFA